MDCERDIPASGAAGPNHRRVPQVGFTCLLEELSRVSDPHPFHADPGSGF